MKRKGKYHMSKQPKQTLQNYNKAFWLSEVISLMEREAHSLIHIDFTMYNILDNVHGPWTYCFCNIRISWNDNYMCANFQKRLWHFVNCLTNIWSQSFKWGISFKKVTFIMIFKKKMALHIPESEVILTLNLIFIHFTFQ